MENYRNFGRVFLWLLLPVLGYAQGLPSNNAALTAARSRQANFGQLPTTFEANQGQTDSAVKFFAKGSGYSVYLTSNGMVLGLRSGKTNPNGSGTSPDMSTAQPSDVPGQRKGNNTPANLAIVVNLAGALPNPKLVGEDPQPGKVNYFIGNDPQQWHTKVPTYGRIRYQNVYPGIDLVYYGHQGKMEFDFVAAPGSDPSKIELEIKGADELAVDNVGNLVLKKGNSEISFQTPGIYQESAGQHIPVIGRYVVKDSTHVGFNLKHYDSTKRLVIDPVLLYSSYLGGSGDDKATGVAVDSAGSAYVVGYSSSVDFPLAGTNSGLAPGAYHVFVAKLDATGFNLVYVDFFGGDCFDFGNGVAVDNTGSAYATGSTCSSNFPLQNPFQSSLSSGNEAAFLTKIAPDGASLAYSTYLGGSRPTEAIAIAVDALNQPHVAGFTYSPDFPLQNAYQTSVAPNGGNIWGIYGFVTKFDATGSALVFSTYLAGNTNVIQPCGSSPCWRAPYSAVNGIALDASGNVYVAGQTNTYNFPATIGAYQTTNSLPYNTAVGFTTDFDPAGNINYSTYFNGSGSGASLTAIAVDNAGSAYVTGMAQSDGTFPLTSTTICDPSFYGVSCGTGFVSKFNPTGSALSYSTFLGPYNAANPTAIVVDSSNDAYVWATSYGGQMPLVNGIENYANQNDGMLVEIDPQAASELFATYLGGSGYEYSAGMALDSAGSIYLSGYADSVDFPATEAAFQTTEAGGLDSFLVKIGPTSAPAVSLTPMSLRYGNQQVGTASQPSVVLLRNMGSAPLTISSVSAAADFPGTNTCGTSVAAAGTCTFSIAFSPTQAGPLNQSILIQDNAAGSPHAINLAGTGLGPTAQVNPTSLVFAALPLGTISPAQPVTLTNIGNTTLTLTNVQISSGFTQTNNCPPQLPASSSCEMQVVFAPTNVGPVSGSMTLTDDAPDSPQSVSLSGSGIGVGSLIFSPPNLAFASTTVSSKSAAQTITVTNPGTASVVFSAIHTVGDFGQTSDCKTLLPNGTCSINVTFSPSSAGSRQGTLTLTDSATGSPQVVNLTGNALDFNVSSASPSFTVKAGATATYGITISPLGGTFPTTIDLACSGAPTTTVCTISPNSVTPKGAAATATVSITSTATVASHSVDPSTNLLFASRWFIAQSTGVFAVVLLVGSSRRRKIGSAFLLLIMTASLGLTGCAIGSANNNKAPGQTGTVPGTYTILITGSAGTLQHSTSLTLTVQ